MGVKGPSTKYRQLRQVHVYLSLVKVNPANVKYIRLTVGYVASMNGKVQSVDDTGVVIKGNIHCELEDGIKDAIYHINWEGYVTLVSYTKGYPSDKDCEIEVTNILASRGSIRVVSI